MQKAGFLITKLILQAFSMTTLKPCGERVGLRVFSTRSDTNQAVHTQMIASSRLEISILSVKELYYLCSENIGADQLRSYREADLRLCFRICKKLVFS